MRFGLSNKSSVKVFDMETNSILIEKEIETNNIQPFLDELGAMKKSFDYEENKDKIKNYLINKYFISR